MQSIRSRVISIACGFSRGAEAIWRAVHSGHADQALSIGFSILLILMSTLLLSLLLLGCVPLSHIQIPHWINIRLSWAVCMTAYIPTSATISVRALPLFDWFFLFAPRSLVWVRATRIRYPVLSLSLSFACVTARSESIIRSFKSTLCHWLCGNIQYMIAPQQRATT